MTAIRDVTEAVSTWTPSRDPRESSFNYIDLSAVDNSLKEITAPTRVTPGEAPSRARQIVAVGDVLVSTVRPNLNAVAVVPSALDGATASTGFTVLRPSRKVVGRYLFHWVRYDAFVADMVRKATGASYPAVSDRIVKDSLLPLPSLDEQRRIAAILDQADDLRAKRRRALAHLDDLTPSIFLEMFGDPLRNPMGWKAATIGDVCTRVTDGEHKTPRRSETGVPLLSARSIQRGWIDFSATDFIGDGEYDVLRKRIEPQEDDVLISCSGTIGRVARVGKLSRFAMVRSAALVRPNDSIVAAFLEQLLTATSMNRLMNARANSSAQANLFQNQIKTLPVILPPLELQLTFERRLDTVRDRHAGLMNGVLMLDELFASLQSRAFRGRL